VSDEQRRKREREARLSPCDTVATTRLAAQERRDRAPLKAVAYDDLFTGDCEGPCERKGVTVRMESSRTMYADDPERTGSNRDARLCAECAREHHEYWDEMWDTYYAGLL
jgi:hypothetical protein